MALTYPGGYITKSPPAPTSTSAPGIWTMDQALQYIKAGTWPTPPIGDPYWQYTTLLSGTGSTNGAQNNTFLDSSTNNFTVTRNGNTTQGTFTPFSLPDGYWGNYFDGSGDYLSVANNAALQFGTGDFAVEFWVYQTSLTGYQTAYSLGYTSAGDFLIQTGAGDGLWTVYIGGSAIVSESTTGAANTWNYIVVTRVGTTLRIFRNGIQTGSATNSGNINSTSTLTIGSGSTYPLFGYMSGLRVLKGTGYTSVTVPTSPATNITNTSLLTCQSNRFVDNSTNAFAITAYGNAAVVPFAPFGNTEMYSTTSVGGSSSTDGAGDYLRVPNGSAFTFTGDFTIEAWVYSSFAAVTGGAGVTIIDTRTQYDLVNWAFAIYTYSSYVDNPQFVYGGGVLSSSINCVKNAWNHVAISRSGSTARIFVNGVQGYSGTLSGTISTGGATNATFLSGFDGSNYLSPSNVSGLRVVNGTAVYTAAFTPPTAPPTAITNTSLLLNFTNAGIYDQAAKNDMGTAGNAQVSTSVIKYGNSMYFDGTGDYLPIPVGQTFDFGTGQFTIECWAYFNSVATGVTVVGAADTGGNIENGVTIYCSASGTLRVYGPSVTNSATATVATGQWYYIAVTRIGNTFSLFLNGNLQGTFTDTGSIVGTNSSKPFYIGSLGVYTSYVMNGYLSDFRVTRGLARYTYSFTPPTRAFGNFYQAQTLTADPYFDYTTLLLPGSGTNGAQNNTFLDSSTNAFSITRNGNTTQGTFSPFSQTGWSNSFGTSNNLANTTSYLVSSTQSTFSVECFVYLNAYTAGTRGYVVGLNTTTGADYLNFGVNSTGKILLWWFDGSIKTAVSTDTVQLNQWVHIAVKVDSNAITFYLNGIASGTGTLTNRASSANGFLIGRDYDGYYVNGYISNLRVTNTAITPTVPTSALTAVTGTQLLTCQSNRFVDNSSNAYTLTTSGTISVQAFSPFAPTAAYSAATNGGSGYFDGTGDYLQATSGTSTTFNGDFTVECWAYLNTTGNLRPFVTFGDYASTGCLFYVTSGNAMAIYLNNSLIVSGGSVVANTWNHFAFVRSGSTITLYLNGTSVGTVTNSSTSGGDSRIGVDYYSSTITHQLNGYISNLRVVKGTAVYTTNFTPPTSPVTAITNTSLLLNFTNAGITDATAKNDLETVGSTQISNGAAKFGSTSITFDGSGDYLAAADNELIRLASGDFTIECWVYPTANGALYDSGFVSYGTPSTLAGWYFGMTGSNTGGTLNRLVWSINYAASGGAPVYGNAGLPLNTWSHVAVTKYGTTVTMFINGNVDKTATVTATPTVSSSYKLYVGAAGYDPTSNQRALTGYLQDVRITKGIARYTQNFTPPTAAFQLL